MIELWFNSPLWRVVLFFAVWLLIWLPAAIPMAIALNWRPFRPSLPNQKLPLLAVLYLLGPVVLGWVNHQSGQSLAENGLLLERSLFTSGALGLGIGIVGIGLLYGVRSLLSRSSLTTKTFWATARQQWMAVLGLLVLALWVGVTEELIFRGFVQTQFQSVWDGWIAAAIASIIFAALHLVWDGAGTVPQLPGLWLMGMVLTLARVVDAGSIGLAWGLHAGWVWGVAIVDTVTAEQPELDSPSDRSSNLPDWVLGIGGQPLAGLLGLGLLIGTGGLIYLTLGLSA